jgi:hypothetical protein
MVSEMRTARRGVGGVPLSGRSIAGSGTGCQQDSVGAWRCVEALEGGLLIIRVQEFWKGIERRAGKLGKRRSDRGPDGKPVSR